MRVIIWYIVASALLNLGAAGLAFYNNHPKVPTLQQCYAKAASQSNDLSFAEAVRYSELLCKGVKP